MGQMTADVLMGCDWEYCWCTAELTPAWFLFVSSSRLVLGEGRLGSAKAEHGGLVEERRQRIGGDEEPPVSRPKGDTFSQTKLLS
ncbi:hypothetical protein VZT92_001570 [Zoarces viviparus]|uniref:Uncharacterized protein n=1 Tax=Zoarces viviparus TaxID=48416 RepID=A0AAW1G3S2_ZOAVI